MASFWSVLLTMRPRQWIKNLLIFAGMVYAGKMTHGPSVARAVAAFVLFSALSGVVYIVNDIFDIEQDRHHPTKSKRPIASGRLAVGTAWLAAAGIALAALALSFWMSPPFGLCALVYVCMMFAYSLRLKAVVILDVLILAIGFVLRALAGTLVISVETTPWFLSCVLFLALFIAICKRRHELLLLNDRAGHHRAVLRDYSTELLDQMVSASTAAAVLSYALWAVAAQSEHAPHPEFRGMILTVPFVVYGIFRYLFLVYHRREGGAPEVLFLTDRALLINVVLWLMVVVLLIYFHDWLSWLPIAGPT